MASRACREAFEQIADGLGIDLRSTDPDSRGIELVDGKAEQALLAAGIVLVASGTAALETTLAKRPMVVAYKVAPLTYAIVTWFGSCMHDALLAAQRARRTRPRTEILQDACTPQALADAVLALFNDTAGRVALVAEFERLHRQLIGDADRGAAAAIAALVDGTARGRVP